MASVKVGENENLESALRRFKKYVESEGILKEYKDRQNFVKPSLKRRLKQKECARKAKLKDNQKRKERESSYSR